VDDGGNIDLRDAILRSDGDIEANLEDGTLFVNENSGNGGTRVETLDSNSATLTRDGGSQDGTVEFGTIS
jgi:hypothetical protein